MSELPEKGGLITGDYHCSFGVQHCEGIRFWICYIAKGGHPIAQVYNHPLAKVMVVDTCKDVTLTLETLKGKRNENRRNILRSIK